MEATVIAAICFAAVALVLGVTALVTYANRSSKKATGRERPRAAAAAQPLLGNEAPGAGGAKFVSPPSPMVPDRGGMSPYEVVHRPSDAPPPPPDAPRAGGMEMPGTYPGYYQQQHQHPQPPPQYQQPPYPPPQPQEYMPPTPPQVLTGDPTPRGLPPDTGSSPPHGTPWGLQDPSTPHSPTSPTGWTGGMHVHLLGLRRHPHVEPNVLIPSMVGAMVRAVSAHGEISQDVAWPCAQAVPPSTAYVWDTSRYIEAPITECSAVEVVFLIPQSDGLFRYCSAVVPMEALERDYPCEAVTTAVDGVSYTVTLGLLTSPDMKKTVLFWKAPAELPGASPGLSRASVNALARTFDEMQAKLPFSALCDVRSVICGPAITCAQLAICYLAPLLRGAQTGGGFANRVVLTRYIPTGDAKDTRFGMNMQEFVTRLEEATDRSFRGIEGVREYLDNEGCVLDTTCLYSKNPHLAKDPCATGGPGFGDDLAELFNQVVYASGVVCVVVPPSSWNTFLERYLSDAVPPAKRRELIAAHALTMTEFDLDLSRSRPIVGFRHVLGGHAASPLASAEPPPPDLPLSPVAPSTPATTAGRTPSPRDTTSPAADTARSSPIPGGSDLDVGPTSSIADGDPFAGGPPRGMLSTFLPVTTPWRPQPQPQRRGNSRTSSFGTEVAAAPDAVPAAKYGAAGKDGAPLAPPQSHPPPTPAARSVAPHLQRRASTPTAEGLGIIDTSSQGSDLPSEVGPLVGPLASSGTSRVPPHVQLPRGRGAGVRVRLPSVAGAPQPQQAPVVVDAPGIDVVDIAHSPSVGSPATSPVASFAVPPPRFVPPAEVNRPVFIDPSPARPSWVEGGGARPPQRTGPRGRGADTRHVAGRLSPPRTPTAHGAPAHVQQTPQEGAPSPAAPKERRVVEDGARETAELLRGMLGPAGADGGHMPPLPPGGRGHLPRDFMRRI